MDCATVIVGATRLVDKDVGLNDIVSMIEILTAYNCPPVWFREALALVLSDEADCDT